LVQCENDSRSLVSLPLHRFYGKYYIQIPIGQDNKETFRT
jgi:hypothetical protein